MSVHILYTDSTDLAGEQQLEHSLGAPSSLTDSNVLLRWAGGRRLLRRWLCRPLTDVRAIGARADAVDVLVEAPELVGIQVFGVLTPDLPV